MTDASDHPEITRIERDRVDSTSDEARRRLGGAGGPFVVAAREQTAGRGRQGRVWSSPPGGLWMTLAWPARLSPPAVMDALGLRIGLALTEAIGERAGVARVRLKWPNDVLIGGRKVAGALTEVASDRERWILIGCGVNADLDLAELPEGVRSSATTLRRELGGEGHAERLAPAIISRLASALANDEPVAALARRAEARLFGLGERVRFRLPDRSHAEGRLEGLDDAGRAVFTLDSGERFIAPPSAELL